MTTTDSTRKDYSRPELIDKASLTSEDLEQINQCRRNYNLCFQFCTNSGIDSVNLEGDTRLETTIVWDLHTRLDLYVW